MTGNKLMSLRALHLPCKKTVARKIVKSGAEARTTWWNCDEMWRCRSLPVGGISRYAKRNSPVQKLGAD
jgi:hypothetical protein